MKTHFIENFDEPAPEKVTAAAIKVAGRIYTGPTHIQAFLSFYQDMAVPADEKSKVLTMTDRQEIDGFLTSFGRFVGREEGYQIALKNRQLKAGWDDPKVAADFTNSEQPKLDSGWMESYAQADLRAMRELTAATNSESDPVRRLFLESTVKVMMRYL
jgi:hypothetical protein